MLGLAMELPNTTHGAGCSGNILFCVLSSEASSHLWLRVFGHYAITYCERVLSLDLPVVLRWRDGRAGLDITGL